MGVVGERRAEPWANGPGELNTLFWHYRDFNVPALTRPDVR